MDYNYEEFYFCPDPDDFISTHFPEEEKDQCLETTQSLADFSASVKCWPLFHKMKMNIISHSDGVINCPEGSETIVVETPAHIRLFSQTYCINHQSMPYHTVCMTNIEFGPNRPKLNQIT